MTQKKFPVKLAILALVIIIIAAGAFIILSPPALNEYSDETSVTERSQNANLLAALYSGGINETLVDVSAQQVYVGYELPGGYDADITQRFVVGAAADASPDSAKIAVLQFDDGQPKTLWTIEMSDFKDYVNAVTTVEEFEAKIGKESY